MDQLHIATQEEDELILLKHTITNGLPNSIKEVPPEIQAYWTLHEDLTIEDGLALKGTRIVIPKSKCKQVLTMRHEGHLGLGKCKLQIKDTVLLCMAVLTFLHYITWVVQGYSVMYIINYIECTMIHNAHLWVPFIEER